ncbi:MAG: BolA/IbaG family iron-sulfur metabolism protein [Gammaproteobacteria bacterium]|nr:BolA/IbaG family iron-sulfur metabolism protein [Gammaproteobacteria bacterium]MCF6229340.1 BolA/IbaG family iron-sulfur metabolism protein [Gammaproteobacteria bacterium]
MQNEQVQVQLLTAFPESEVLVSGEGCNFAVTIISKQFEGLSRVQEQKLVYATLSEQIASGEIHAVTIKAYTPEEWATLAKNVS